MRSEDTIEDFDLVDEIRVLINTALEPVNQRLTTIEKNIDFILADLQPMHQRMSLFEKQQTLTPLTPVPYASSR